MTTETMTIIDLEDIARIIFECAKCSARISAPFPDRLAPEASRCPACREDWKNSQRPSYENLLADLEEQLKANGMPGATYRIRLEVKPQA